jgi:polygalacturonase
VKNCTFENTENGIRIKSDLRRGGLVENISYSDITMSNVAPAITFTCNYQNNSSGDAKKSAETQRPEAGTENRPLFRNIQVTNLRATSQKNAGIILGLPDNCISNVVFENVQISAPKGLTVRNAHGVLLKNSKIQAADGVPIISDNAKIETLENSAQR